MASRNVLKIDIPDSYYHVYARGSNKMPIYIDDDDYEYFLTLLRRYLSQKEMKNQVGTPYVKLFNSVRLQCFCLMQNHFHLLLYQIEPGAMQRLMRGVMTSYSSYFNRKYDRSGPLFETRYKASRISSDDYFMHISRYIHLNPDKWETYQFSSIHAYAGQVQYDWLETKNILAMFDTPTGYLEFVRDYKEIRDVYEDIKHELAN
ncbi:transposase [Candidatus Saccharibacteria bacterium]|nr:transposase [Candidatus Saccharibacteria bacterium]